MEYLKQIPLFSQLDNESLKKIESIIEELTVEKDKFLFYENDPGDAFYIIKEGRVSVLKNQSDGTRKLIVTLGKGDFFGELALINGECRNATIKCDTDCKFLVISKEKFDVLLRINLSISVQIIKVITKRLKEESENKKKIESKIISVCSPKGGSGRSVIISNLAVSLASLKKSVVILDCDLQFGDQAMMFNILNSNTIGDLVKNEKIFNWEIIKKYIEKTDIENLYLLSAPSKPEEAELISRNEIVKIIDILKDNFDFILIDTPSYFLDVAISVYDISDIILLVTEVDLNSIKNAKSAMKVLEKLNYSDDKIKIIVNKLGKNKAVNSDNISNSLSKKIFCELPYVPYELTSSINRGESIVSYDVNNPFSRSIINMAKKLNGENIKQNNFFENVTLKIKSIYGAIAKWKRVKEMEPKYAVAYYNLGLAYKTKGMIDEAISEYKQAISLNPDYADCHYYLGLAYLEKGVLDDAGRSFENALHINPKYKEAKSRLGLAYLKMNKLDKAKEVLESLVSEYPYFADSLNYLGKTYVLMKKYDKACEVLKKALDINPRYIQARLNLAECYEALNFEKEAIEEYRRILNETEKDNDFHILAKKKISSMCT